MCEAYLSVKLDPGLSPLMPEPNKKLKSGTQTGGNLAQVTGEYIAQSVGWVENPPEAVQLGCVIIPTGKIGSVCLTHQGYITRLHSAGNLN